MSSPITLNRRSSHPLHWIWVAASCLWLVHLPGRAAEQTNTPRVARLVMHDVHVFSGGQNLFIQSNGVAHVQVIERKQEARYQLQLLPNEMILLGGVLRAHDSNHLKIKDSHGIVDEKRIAIQIEYADSTKREVGKWQHEHNEDFDWIHLHLLGIVEQARKTTPVYRGARNDKWKPEGF